MGNNINVNDKIVDFQQNLNKSDLPNYDPKTKLPEKLQKAVDDILHTDKEASKEDIARVLEKVEKLQRNKNKNVNLTILIDNTISALKAAKNTALPKKNISATSIDTLTANDSTKKTNTLFQTIGKILGKN